MTFVLASQALSNTIGLGFTWFILTPAIVTGLIVVAVVTAKGEKRENEKYAASRRWARKPDAADDA
jgi:hypothetical protein